MKGIREAAMSSESEPEYIPQTHYYPETHKQKHNSSLFDYDNYPPVGSYKVPAPVKGVIEIKLNVSADELGPVGDDTSNKYDWNKAQNKAEEIAYDRIEELLGKGFESRYSIEFNVYDDGVEYEVSCILTPTQK
jgi:hypothetical protein